MGSDLYVKPMQDSYFATVKLIYTIGYGTSLVFLFIAVVILLLFR